MIFKCGSRGGQGGLDPPLKNHKYIGFFRNTGPDPLKITKLPSQDSMLGHHRHYLKGVSLAAGDGLILVLFGSTH